MEESGPQSADVPPPLPEAGQQTDGDRGRIFPCEECGADLEFNIGVQQLKCPYCGTVKKIEIDEEVVIEEQDFHAALERLKELREKQAEAEPEHSEVRCESCSSEVIFTGTLTSTNCPYCGSPIQREKIHAGGFRLAVNGVIPFRIEERKANQIMRDWVQSLWFAPNDFKKHGVDENFNGVYLPFWTFDSLTFNRYSGQRGENYTVRVGTGKNRRTETRTRWYPASGKFQRFFDDVLISGCRGVTQKHIDELSPWPLHTMIPFNQQVLAGHFARTYDVEVEPAFAEARRRVERLIDSDVRSRIGGDKQRVHDIDTRYDAITFKHLLLPVWMLAYKYKEKTYRVYINASTGEIQGDRPYSWLKITLTVLGTVLAFLIILGLLSMR